jgi:hypothetical protein
MTDPTPAEVEAHAVVTLCAHTPTSRDGACVVCIARALATARAQGEEAMLDSPLVAGCIAVVAEINRRWGATSYVDAIVAVERAVLQAREEG